MRLQSILNGVRLVVWPSNFGQAVIASIVAFMIVSVGSFNPPSVHRVAVTSYSYDAWFLGIYGLMLLLSAALFGANLVLFARFRNSRKMIIVAQLIHMLLFLGCFVWGLTLF